MYVCISTFNLLKHIMHNRKTKKKRMKNEISIRKKHFQIKVDKYLFKEKEKATTSFQCYKFHFLIPFHNSH